MFPVGSVVFQRQALMKLNDAVALYHQARKRKSGVAWHRVRICHQAFSLYRRELPATALRSLGQRFEGNAGPIGRDSRSRCASNLSFAATPANWSRSKRLPHGWSEFNRRARSASKSFSRKQTAKNRSGLIGGPGYREETLCFPFCTREIRTAYSAS